MTVDEIRDHASLLAVRSEWTALVERVSGRNPFVAPQFMLPYLNHLGTRYDCRVLVARENTRMIGFCPTFIRRSGRSWLPIRRISFPTHGTSPPFEIVVEDGREDVVVSFVEHWKKSHDWDLIELQNVPATAQTEAMLQTAVSRAGLRLSGENGRISIYVPIAGTWEDYFRSLPKKYRAATRRSARLCAEAGEVRIVSYPADLTEFDRALAWIADITRRSWKTGHEAAAQDGMGSLLTELAAEGLLEICFVTINEKPVAYLVNILYKRQLNAYHTAYDLDYMPQGPTAMLLQHSIIQCFRNGYPVYDLLGDRQLHIRRWSSTYVQYRNLRITRNTPLARLRAELFCRLRDERLRHARRSTNEQKEEAMSAARTRQAEMGRSASDAMTGDESDRLE